MLGGNLQVEWVLGEDKRENTSGTFCVTLENHTNAQ